MKIFLTILLISVFFVVRAQTVQVLNAKTGKPVEGVLLFSEKFSTQTMPDGKAEIGNFELKQEILFKHSSFLKLISTKEKIVKQGGIVLLIEDPVRLDEIIVSVNRWEQSKTEIPQTIETIDAIDVIKYSPANTADLLGTKGGVFIQKSQMGGGSPMIRGYSANRVLIVVDGIRMNNAIYRSGNLHNVISVDALSLENTEVIFGPGSVIYGSDALGGVMSFNTLSPKLVTGHKLEQTGKMHVRTASANFEKTAHFSYNLGSKKWAGLVAATLTDFDDLKMGTNGPDEYLRPFYVEKKIFSGVDYVVENSNPEIQKYTAYKQWNALAKIRFRPNEKHDFQLSAHLSQTSDIPRYDRLIQTKNNTLSYAEWFYGPQKWSLISGKYQYNLSMAMFDKINVLLGYQNYEESRSDRRINNENQNTRTENLSIYSLNIDFAKSFDTKSELFYGIEGYFNQIRSSGFSKNMLSGKELPLSSRYPDGSTYSSLAGYYSFQYNLSKRVIFQFGSRFTVTEIEGTFDPDFYNFPFSDLNSRNSSFNGNLGIVYHPTQDWQINIHTATGFRSPNIDDIAKVFDSEPGNVIVPNPDLKPEYARNLELSVIRSYSSKARIEITGFYSWLKNAMVRRDFVFNGQDSIFYDGTLSKVEAIVNAESASIWGTTLSFEYLFNNKFRTRNDLTFTTGKDNEGVPVRHVPPTFGSSHLIYENQKLFIDLYFVYNGQLDYEQLAPDEQDKPHLYLPDETGRPYSPSWYTINTKANYQLKRNVTLAAGAENLLNKRYRPYSSGVVSPGLNFTASITVRY